MIRFFYENPGVFTPEQLTEIKRTSLAQVICQSGDNIRRIQRDVFIRVKSDDEYVNCDSIPRLDLRMWSDCCEGALIMKYVFCYHLLYYTLRNITVYMHYMRTQLCSSL